MDRDSTHNDPEFSDDSTTSSNLSSGAPKRIGLRNITSRATSKVKKAIEHGTASLADENKSKDADVALEHIQDEPAFNPTRVDKQLKVAQAKERGLVEQAKVAVEVSAWSLAHPRQAAKAKAKRLAAGKLSSIQKPHALPKTGLELLDAHDALSISESPDSSRDNSPERERLNRDWNRKRARVARLEQQRDSMQVAWITRHTDRVRVVPKEHITVPDREFFIHRDSEGNFVRYRWEKWLGYVSSQECCHL